MSEAYKCDSCGEYRLGMPPNTIQVKNTCNGFCTASYIPEGEYDICKDCTDKFKEVLK